MKSTPSNMIESPTYPPIWVINLKKSIDRREFMVNQLNALGLPFQLIEAVDGNSLTPQEVATVYDPEQAVRHMRRELVRGEIGCSLSHLMLFQKMIDENVEEAIILEDDAKISPDFLKIMQRKAFFPKNWELMLFYHRGIQISFWKRQKFYMGYCFVKFASMAYGLVGYLMKQSAARKILSQAYPLRIPIDHLTGGQIKTGVKLYGLNPPCVQHLFADDPNYTTTMPDRDLLENKLWAQDNIGKFHRLWKQHGTRATNFYIRMNPKCII